MKKKKKIEIKIGDEIIRLSAGELGMIASGAGMTLVRFTCDSKDPMCDICQRLVNLCLELSDKAYSFGVQQLED